MEQRVSLITLGVRDLGRARRFYETLGWKTRADPDDDVVFFQAGGMIVALWDREELAVDSGVEDSGGWGGVTLAYNVRSPEEVDAVIAQAEAAGAEIPRYGAETFWGGYSGVFVDPEGHAWEVAHNPRWTLRPDGSVELPKYQTATWCVRRRAGAGTSAPWNAAAPASTSFTAPRPRSTPPSTSSPTVRPSSAVTPARGGASRTAAPKSCSARSTPRST